MDVRLVETENKYWASINAINENFVNISDQIVKQYPMLLAGGMWGTITLVYDETEVHNKKIRPFKVEEFTPFQISMIDIREFIEKRKQFTTDEWVDILINSFGLNPTKLTRREKILTISRAIPLVEPNHNMIELGPRETGKTYLYRNVSYYTHVLSGGKATPANLFINNNTGQVGLVGTREAVVFDEIANTNFTDPQATVSIMQGYMQDAKFSRGKKEILAFGSIVMVGNLDVQNKVPHESYYHLLQPLPDFMQVEALIDRLHYYLPGWEMPKITPSLTSKDYGFISDYFCEIMHELRRVELMEPIKKRFELYDSSDFGIGLTTRDHRGILKNLSGLMRLIYPHGELSNEELAELLSLAIEGRQRVRDQLHLMAPGEYAPIEISGKILETGSIITPVLSERRRKRSTILASEPRVGEIIGLAVAGDMGVILQFEMQTTKGHGRILPLGSIQKVMRESIEAAAQYIKTHTSELGLSDDWHENYDIAVLATMMGIPKEGPSAGVTMVAGIVSALTEHPVRNDVALTGEITIMGKVLPVGGIQQKIMAAIDVGLRTVILPEGNRSDVEYLPEYIKEQIEIIFVESIGEVLNQALV
jgi:ATP-dependent Lon protease